VACVPSGRDCHRLDAHKSILAYTKTNVETEVEVSVSWTDKVASEPKIQTTCSGRTSLVALNSLPKSTWAEATPEDKETFKPVSPGPVVWKKPSPCPGIDCVHCRPLKKIDIPNNGRSIREKDLGGKMAYLHWHRTFRD
jgi:hypothetical protein